ncbi:hypothetical protein U1P98_18990 [Lysinibacillus irui]|uniref:Uncharacterized protein n=1 Tax=Lysinibacillus irui TaxID=2998077 RepID=A0ABU5NQS8_9BACI|nr:MULTISPECIES: hypothetical protein [Lysinibacillus]MEA0552439.1 hypothetical protein [Lysinibacillus irui]MEA0978391.1 hypothetical protein [Lysinibacillus irui]MEA1044545.1 hypothetical protein [Lysinibacillus irui]
MDIIVLIAILLIIFFTSSTIEKKIEKMNDKNSEIIELLKDIKNELKNK